MRVSDREVLQPESQKAKFVYVVPSAPGLREYAVTSAFNDSRFSPITKQELSSLTVSVSILLVSSARHTVWFDTFAMGLTQHHLAPQNDAELRAGH